MENTQNTLKKRRRGHRPLGIPVEYVNADVLGKITNPPLSIGTIRKLQNSRAIPFVRIGRRVLFSPAAVKATLEKNFTIFPRGEAPRPAA